MGQEVTLEQLLQSRDERAMRQKDWIMAHPSLTLVCLTVILPGPVKRDSRSLRVAAAGVEAIRSSMSPVKEECFDLLTGFEGYFLVDGTLAGVKEACCRIEDSHPLGRLMDIDVLRLGEYGVVPVSRSEAGLPPRRCLICDLPARECMRARKHSREELLQKIDEILYSADNL